MQPTDSASRRRFKRWGALDERWKISMESFDVVVIGGGVIGAATA